MEGSPDHSGYFWARHNGGEPEPVSFNHKRFYVEIFGMDLVYAPAEFEFLEEIKR